MRLIGVTVPTNAVMKLVLDGQLADAVMGAPHTTRGGGPSTGTSLGGLPDPTVTVVDPRIWNGAAGYGSQDRAGLGQGHRV
jgi:hypothetical protein